MYTSATVTKAAKVVLWLALTNTWRRQRRSWCASHVYDLLVTARCVCPSRQSVDLEAADWTPRVVQRLHYPLKSVSGGLGIRGGLVDGSMLNISRTVEAAPTLAPPPAARSSALPGNGSNHVLSANATDEKQEAARLVLFLSTDDIKIAEEATKVGWRRIVGGTPTCAVDLRKGFVKVSGCLSVHSCVGAFACCSTHKIGH